MAEASSETLVEAPPQTDRNGMSDVDVKMLSSAALARLVEEVRHDDPPLSNTYDRVHNRHNR